MFGLLVHDFPSQDGPENSKYAIPRLGIWIRNGLTAVFLVWCAVQTWFYFSGISFRPAPMLFSGSATGLLGLWLGMGVPGRIHAVIDALRQTGVLKVSSVHLAALHERLEREASREALWGALIVGFAEAGVIVSGVVFVPMLVYGRSPFASYDPMNFAGLLAVGIVGGSIAGWFLGRFAGYSEFPESVRDVGGDLALLPDATDRLGGLSPLVGFVRRQSVLTLLPMVWVGGWLVLTAAVPDLAVRYGFWRFPLIMLFGLAVFYGERGFLRPTRSIQRLFASLVASADRMGDSKLRQEALSASKRVWPRPGIFFLALLFLILMALVFGLPHGVRTFVFGP